MDSYYGFEGEKCSSCGKEMKYGAVRYNTYGYLCTNISCVLYSASALAERNEAESWHQRKEEERQEAFDKWSRDLY